MASHTYPASESEPVVWRILCTNNGATGYLYTEKLPFEPGPGVKVRREPEPLFTGLAQGVLAPTNCGWPDAPFTFLDEPGEHDPCYVVMPDGAMLSLNHHATAGVDIARAKFIVDACNAALSPDFPRAAIAEAMQDAWNTICADTDCHPLDIERQGKKLFFKPGHWVDLIALFLSRSPSVPSTVLCTPSDGGSK